MNTRTLQRLRQHAAHYQLGEPRAFIAGPPRPPLSRLGIVALIIGLILVVVLALVASLLITLLSLWQLMLVLLVALLWIVVGFWLLFASMQQRMRIKTLLCTNGIVWSYRRSAEVIRWPDIESLWRTSAGGSARRYEVRLRDGRVVVLDSRIAGAEELARFIEQAVIAHHLPSLMQAYQNSSTLKFGPLSISQRGLQVAEHPGEVLAWHQITYIRNIQGVLHIRAKHTTTLWTTLDLSTIPNVCLVAAMIHSIYDLHRTPTPDTVQKRSA